MAEAESTRFLYYLSVYVILSKNSFFWCLTPGFDFSSRNPAALGIAQVNLALPSLARFLSESGCKGTTFQDSLQTFRQLFFGGGEYFRDYLQNVALTIQILTSYSSQMGSDTTNKENTSVVGVTIAASIKIATTA